MVPRMFFCQFNSQTKRDRARTARKQRLGETSDSQRSAIRYLCKVLGVEVSADLSVDNRKQRSPEQHHSECFQHVRPVSQIVV